MLDKYCENFLKYIIKNQIDNCVSDIPSKVSEIGMSYDFINEACKKLKAEGYIDTLDADDGVFVVFLKHKGAVYFKTRRSDKINHWKELLSSEIIKNIVTFALGAIISNSDRIITFIKVLLLDKP